MKIIVIGASGTIGRAVSEELSQRHEVIRVGRTRGDYQVDITSQESVEALFAQTGEVDAIVSTTGNLHFGPLSTMTDSQFNLGCRTSCWDKFAWRWSASIFCATGVDYPGQRYCRAGTHCSGGQCHDGQRRSGRLCPRRRLRTAARDPHQSHQPHRAQRVAGGLRRLFPGLPQRSRRRRGAGLSPQH